MPLSPEGNASGDDPLETEAADLSRAPESTAVPEPTSGTDHTNSQPPEDHKGVLIPARIEAEDFVRFNEIDASNDAADCGDDRADLGLTDDDNGGCYVGWTQPDEWLEYDIWVAEAAQFDVALRVASDNAQRTLEVVVDGQSVGSLSGPGAGWTTFENVTLSALPLAAGAHSVRLRFVTGQANVNYLVFSLPDTELDPNTTSPPIAEAPAIVQPAPAAPPSGKPYGCATAPSGYTLSWSDEFDYEGLPDSQRWSYETGGDGWGNNELQYYTGGRPENASVADGVLTITAVPEQYQGNTYTSAKLNSGLGNGNPGTWNEGVFKFRARLPAGLGTWPAIWMMPTHCTEGWPNCGEIDIMEHVGYDEGRVHGTIHTDAFNHVEGTQNGKDTVVADATSAFHEYTLIWTTDRLEWMVDDKIYHSIDKLPSWGFAEWPFNEKDWHLMLNLAVGGDWGGAQGVDRADFPAKFELDYVCVYQK